MLRFETEVDWRTHHYFLKWEVPLDIYSSEAFYETQFGFLSRPTHRNTSWDAAKFEVCGHKYIDLSEYGYGMALLNESKYGFAVEGNTMRISLLRGATGPDPEQDQGKHSFKFALLPHREHFLQTDVPQLAAAFNAPLHVQYGSHSTVQKAVAEAKGPFRVEGAPNVILDTVKRGEDDDYLSKKGSSGSPGKTVICRLYESKGGHARATLVTSLPVKSATVVDLLERKLHDVNVVASVSGSKSDSRKKIQLAFRGFEIVTVKLELEADADDDESSGSEDAWTEV